MLYWHAQVTFKSEHLIGPDDWLLAIKATLRGYHKPDGFQAHIPFVAIAQVDVIKVDGRTRAFISGALRRDGGQLGRADFRSLAKLLRAEFGVTKATADRDGEVVVMTADRWGAGSTHTP